MSVKNLVEELDYAQKVHRSLRLIKEAFERYGDDLVLANSLGKDSVVVWDLAMRINPAMKGFIVTTPFKPLQTKIFMGSFKERYPHVKIYESAEEVTPKLYETDPDECCRILKVEPTKRALRELRARCWITGLRCTEGVVREDYEEVQHLDKGLEKLNPILTWREREVWQYIALNRVKVNQLYAYGYRSLGCGPCSRRIASGEPNERAGRWKNTCKVGGECGIHTRPLKEK